MAEVEFYLNGAPVVVTDDGCSLLEALRDRLAIRSAKDGCAPQGQCGCCTVWVDGQPRVACVTPVSRVRGRAVTTIEGLDSELSGAWADAMCSAGATQCGFCTPGIVMRLAAEPVASLTPERVGQALLAHLCRCTGWQTITEAALAVRGSTAPPMVDAGDGAVGERAAASFAVSFVAPNSERPARDFDAASRRAALEGGVAQVVAPDVALGTGGFADDRAPRDALVAICSTTGEWFVGDTVSEARRLAGRIQGRRTTVAPSWPIEVPVGEWDRVVQTTWVEPGYLEPDASWCVPGGEPASMVGNGGAFGGKLTGELPAVARRLADLHGRPVRVLRMREDVVRFGPKRPPLAAGVMFDGSGIVRVARTPGIAAAINRMLPNVTVDEVDIAGPPTSAGIRAAGWAESAVLAASLGAAPDHVIAPGGGSATATIADDGSVDVVVRCGRPLDEIVLRSYCIGAAHMALGWVRSEAIAVDETGAPLDLTVRSFGILRAVDMPMVRLTIEASDDEPVNGSDAVFAAVAAAAWRDGGFPSRWPIR